MLSAADRSIALVDAVPRSTPTRSPHAAVAVARRSWSPSGSPSTRPSDSSTPGERRRRPAQLNLDRHWRNARTVASHSPLDYKAHAVGNYVVNGTTPPANGYF